MSFQYILKVEKPEFYVDVAFNAATKKADAVKSKNKNLKRIELVKKVESARVGTTNRTVESQMNAIINSFPKLAELTPFYLELIKCTLDAELLKKSLAALNWIVRKSDEFSYIYLDKITGARQAEWAQQARREYFGRVSSLFKHVKEVFRYLEESRKVLKNFPVIKQMPTVVICGFPNVGKTTLLSKMTVSRPEIAPYPFTTKQINLGYSHLGDMQVQFIDTPGTLNRFEKMNHIEKQAYLAAKYCSDVLVYVYDLTEPYPMRDQHELLEKFAEFNKPIILYLSKTDILPEDLVAKFKGMKEVICDMKTLREKLDPILREQEKLKPKEKPKEEKVEPIFLGEPLDMDESSEE